MLNLWPSRFGWRHFSAAGRALWLKTWVGGATSKQKWCSFRGISFLVQNGFPLWKEQRIRRNLWIRIRSWGYLGFSLRRHQGILDPKSTSKGRRANEVFIFIFFPLICSPAIKDSITGIFLWEEGWRGSHNGSSSTPILLFSYHPGIQVGAQGPSSAGMAQQSVNVQFGAIPAGFFSGVSNRFSVLKDFSPRGEDPKGRQDNGLSLGKQSGVPEDDFSRP